jgi:pimeloyl-ACP methyl ester carboxylesterase
VSSRLRTVGLYGGLAGVAIAGTVVGVLRWRRRPAGLGDALDEALGELPGAHGSTVVAEDGVALWVEEREEREPELTVVFVHGFTLDRRTWHFQFRDLPRLVERRVRLVRYDQRGHGRSGRSTRQSSTIDQLGRDLDAVLRELAPDGPLVLVGHSMGAMTIMALAEHRPELFADRVVGVALLCTSAGDLASMALARPFLSRRSMLATFGAMAASRRPGMVEWGRRATASASRPVIRKLSFGVGPVDQAMVDLVDRMMAATSVEVMTNFLRTLGEHDRYRALAALRHCHVLVMGGDADRVTPYSHTEAMAAQLPDAELVRIPGAGHLAMLERPEFVNEHLAALLSRCAERAAKGRRRWWRR